MKTFPLLSAALTFALLTACDEQKPIQETSAPVGTATTWRPNWCPLPAGV